MDVAQTTSERVPTSQCSRELILQTSRQAHTGHVVRQSRGQARKSALYPSQRTRDLADVIRQRSRDGIGKGDLVPTRGHVTAGSIAGDRVRVGASRAVARAHRVVDGGGVGHGVRLGRAMHGGQGGHGGALRDRSVVRSCVGRVHW